MPWCKCAKCAAKSGQVLSNSWPNSSCFKETTHPIRRSAKCYLLVWNLGIRLANKKNNHSSPWPRQAGKDLQILKIKKNILHSIIFLSICPPSYLPIYLPIYLPLYLPIYLTESLEGSVTTFPITIMDVQSRILPRFQVDCLHLIVQWASEALIDTWNWAHAIDKQGEKCSLWQSLMMFFSICPHPPRQLNDKAVWHRIAQAEKSSR